MNYWLWLTKLSLYYNTFFRYIIVTDIWIKLKRERFKYIHLFSIQFIQMGCSCPMENSWSCLFQGSRFLRANFYELGPFSRSAKCLGNEGGYSAVVFNLDGEIGIRRMLNSNWPETQSDRCLRFCFRFFEFSKGDAVKV